MQKLINVYIVNPSVTWIPPSAAHLSSATASDWTTDIRHINLILFIHSFKIRFVFRNIFQNRSLRPKVLDGAEGGDFALALRPVLALFLLEVPKRPSVSQRMLDNPRLDFTIDLVGCQQSLFGMHRFHLNLTNLTWIQNLKQDANYKGEIYGTT